MSDWQPIKTAPADIPVELGGWTDGYFTSDRQPIWKTTVGVAWETRRGWFGRTIVTATYLHQGYLWWRPLPEPPQ